MKQRKGRRGDVNVVVRVLAIPWQHFGRPQRGLISRLPLCTRGWGGGWGSKGRTERGAGSLWTESLKWYLGKWGQQGDRQAAGCSREKKKKNKEGANLFSCVFWFRNGRGCGLGWTPLRGVPPLCGHAACASCAPSSPCGGGVGNGGPAELVKQERERDREKNSLIY